MDFDNVIALLTGEMRNPSKVDGVGSDIVVLLGAGCSCQYGLPNFRELLSNLYCDVYPKRRQPDTSWSTADLRGKLDQYWLEEKAERIREKLAVYLRLVRGADCLGYRRLARLIKSRRIKTVVNLNFDILLEEALEAEGFEDQFVVSTTFTRESDKFILIKPHGSIGRVDLRRDSRDILVLDLAHTELFDRQEKLAAHSLLSNHEVILLGYSGSEAKIAEALRPSRHQAKKRLFVINVDHPSGIVLRAMGERLNDEGGTPGDLSVIGEEATFENFMEYLAAAMSPDTSAAVDDEEATDPRPSLMTRSERSALARCLKEAVQLRLSLNVAERSKISIREHGLRVFASCLTIARNAGICLSSIEKYLLHCVAYLHDLGYFNGYARGRVADNPGWRLLCEHGAQTAEMLGDRFRRDPQFLRGMIPRSYRFDERNEERFGELICEICRGHTGMLKGKVSEEDSVFRIDGVNLHVRFRLIVTLFALAEDLSEAHPFLPSADPIGALEVGRHDAIVDPVLDLYLNPRNNRITFQFSKGRISGNVLQGGRPALARWLNGMTAYHVGRFDRECRDSGGWGMTFDSQNAPPTREGIKDLLRKALEETLKIEVQALSRRADGAHPQISEQESLLDLVALYALPREQAGESSRQWIEPRVSLLRPVIDRVLKPVKSFGGLGEEGQQEFLGHYLALVLSAEPARLSSIMFLRSYERIIYPAWRFFARNWHDGIEAVLMARACLDLGSSLYRVEMADGLTRLLDPSNGYIQWRGEKAYGHKECTLCTARLLYILSHARRHFAVHRHPRKGSAEESIDKAIKGIFCYLRNRKPDDPSWWGFGGAKDSEHEVHSADYLAWVPRAIAFCLSVDREIQKKSGVKWLDERVMPSGEVEGLLAERCEHLFSAGSELLSRRAEEPFSYVTGHVATAYFHLMRLTRQRPLPILVEEQTRRTFAREILAAADRVGDVARGQRTSRRALSQMSRFYLWPTLLLRSLLNPRDRAVEDELVDLCTTCVFSRIWIHDGPDTGSWGFNVKNTQSIVSSLVDFWTFALAKSNANRFARAFERAKRPITALLEDV